MCAREKAGPLMVENKALRCNARGDMAGTYCVTASTVPGLFVKRNDIMNLPVPVPVATIVLLILSNVFMTFAWYGHLRYKALPLLAAIVISWGIAFFEYLLQVPANRVGYGYFSAAELKAIQVIISLSVFAFFSTLYLGESLRWNHLVGFSLIVLAAFFIFKKW